MSFGFFKWLEWIILYIFACLGCFSSSYYYYFIFFGLWRELRRKFHGAIIAGTKILRCVKIGTNEGHSMFQTQLRKLFFC